MSMCQNSNWLIATQVNWLFCTFLLLWIPLSSNTALSFIPSPASESRVSHALCPPIPLPFLTASSSVPHCGTFASLFKCLCPCFAFVSPIFSSAYLSLPSQHLSPCRLSQAWGRVKQLSTNSSNEVRPCIPLTGISGATLWSLSAFND